MVAIRILPTAYYLRAVSAYRSVSEVDKDEGDTRKAENYLLQVIQKFSGTDYALDASVKLNAIKNQRAAKELVTGKFYHYRREFLAALTRYQNVVNDFPDRLTSKRRCIGSLRST